MLIEDKVQIEAVKTRSYMMGDSGHHEENRSIHYGNEKAL